MNTSSGSSEARVLAFGSQRISVFLANSDPYKQIVDIVKVYVCSK